MDKAYQELIASLSGRQNKLLTSLLSSEDSEKWEQSKYLIVSHSPLLTLEMAVNRVCQRKSRSIPTPSEIYAALEYAKTRSQQFANQKTQNNVAENSYSN